MLREDLAQAMWAISQLRPDTKPSPATLQRLADLLRTPIARIDEWATAGSMKLGRILLHLKAAVPHGGWMRLFKDGKQHVERPIPMSVQKAEAMMRLAAHKAFREPEVLKALPLGSWRTLDELTRLETRVLRQGVKSGRVHRNMTRGEARALQQARRLAEETVPVAVDPFRAVRAALQAYTADREALVAFVCDHLGIGRA